MAHIRQTDALLRDFVVTYNDPRVEGAGRPGLPGSFLIWVDADTERAYPMIKHGTEPTEWEPVFSGTEGPTGGVATADIEDLAVTTGKLAALAVTTAKLALLSVTDAQLAANAVITAKILDLNVTTGKLAALAVTDAKLAADAVTTAKILDANVTAAKLAATVVAAIPGTPTISVDAQIGTTRTSTVQLKNIAGGDLAAKAHVRVWVSDVAAGAPTATAPNGGTGIGDGVTIATITANKVFDLVSGEAGDFTVALTESGVGPTTWYVNVAIGAHVASAAVAIAN
jgi:hypothetical protein